MGLQSLPGRGGYRSVRILCLDVGDRRIGVAVSDPTGTIASPLSVIYRSAERKDHEAVATLVADQAAEAVLVGLPRTLRGEIGPQAHRVIVFADRLRTVLPVPVEFWDERHSTVDAEEIVRHRGARKGRSGTAVDHVAAAVILQSYLDAMRSNPAMQARPTGLTGRQEDESEPKI